MAPGNSLPPRARYMQSARCSGTKISFARTDFEPVLRMRDFQAVQLRVAKAGAMIEAAQLLVRDDCLAGQRIAAEGGVPAIEEKLRYRRNVAWAMDQCTEAIDSLHALAGANGIYDRYPIQRLFRDQHALAAHIGFSWDAQGGAWALVTMGGKFDSPTM